jgi:hypothetical protein
MTWLLLIAALMAHPARAESGNGGRGGGYAILCYKSERSFRDVVANARLDDGEGQPYPIDLHLDDLRAPPILVDYFEAIRGRFVSSEDALKSVSWGRPELDSGDPRVIFERAHALATRWVYEDLRIATSRATSGGRRPGFWDLFDLTRTAPADWSFSDGGVPHVPDARFQRIIPPNCAYVQVAYFNDGERKVLVDQRIYQLMNMQNRAALWVHEDVTHYYRAGLKQCQDTIKSVHLYGAVYVLMTHLPETLSARDAYAPSNCDAHPNQAGCMDLCVAPSVDTTDPARKFVVHLLNKNLADGRYRNEEFRFLSNEISLSVEFGLSEVRLLNMFIFDGWVTYMIRRLDQRKLFMLTAPGSLRIGWGWLKSEGIQAPFPPKYLDRN